MKKLIPFIMLLCFNLVVVAQVDKEKLALDVSKADAANTEKLKMLMWKRHSTATVNGEVKATVINEVSFDDAGKLEVTTISAETTADKKPGLRGKAQENAAEEGMEYVGNALNLALSYTYLSKGQMLDFFDKATITEANGIFTVVGENIFVKGDKLTLLIDAKTNLFISRTFSTTMEGGDPVTGDVEYGTFTSGTNHVKTTVLNLPAKKAVVTAKNSDYTQRIQ